MLTSLKYSTSKLKSINKLLLILIPPYLVSLADNPIVGGMSLGGMTSFAEGKPVIIQAIQWFTPITCMVNFCCLSLQTTKADAVKLLVSFPSDRAIFGVITTISNRVV
jgi:hypothetical protein